MSALFGGIEAGGTKVVCAVGDDSGNIQSRTQFPTTQPEETIQRAIDYFHREQEQHGELAAIGIGSFGPVDVDPQSPTFGTVTTTPKPGWQDVPFIEQVQDALDLPVGFDTDVNAAALGEARWGAAQKLTDFIYLTVGTGIGGGALVNGDLLHGMIHPEMGHMLIPHDKAADPFEGNCPYHGDCLEGLAAGPALEARWEQDPKTLPEDHPAWELEARYLSLGLANLIMTLSPQRIVMGGGVMEQKLLFPLVRARTIEALNGYVEAPQILADIEAYIVPPGLGSNAGVLGAIALGIRAHRSEFSAGD